MALEKEAKMKVYLAAPFFTYNQIALVQGVEDMFATLKDYELYSPRSEGIILKDMPPHRRKEFTRKVFDRNIEKIEWCNIIVAIIDDRDPGTMFEMGYGHARNKRIVSYTGQDYGLNVMLQECVVAHVRRLPDLAYLFQHGVTDGACANFQVFNPNVT
jgi:nucleoside 2-deoxyribosyltransferase